jgi:hypothetical protein
MPYLMLLLIGFVLLVVSIIGTFRERTLVGTRRNRMELAGRKAWLVTIPQAVAGGLLFGMTLAAILNVVAAQENLLLVVGVGLGLYLLANFVGMKLASGDLQG